MSDCWSLKKRNEGKASPVSLVSWKGFKDVGVDPNLSACHSCGVVPKLSACHSIGVVPKLSACHSCGVVPNLSACHSVGVVPNLSAGRSTEQITESKVQSSFGSFLSEGSVSFVDNLGEEKPIVVLRDTGAAQTVLLEGVLPLSENSSEHANVIVEGVEGGYVSLPLHKLYLKTKFVTGPVSVGIIRKIPVEGVSLLLGNDLAGDRVNVAPLVCEKPVTSEDTELLGQQIPNLFPACVVTRSMAEKAEEAEVEAERDKVVIGDGENAVSLADTFYGQLVKEDSGLDVSPTAEAKGDSGNPEVSVDVGHNGQLPSGREALMKAQKADPEVRDLVGQAVTPQEVETVPVCYFLKSGILMRKYRPPEVPADDEWKVVYQIVVPNCYRQEILHMAHELPVAGHLGINKTQDRILQHFFWPGLRRDVAEFVKTCHTCQMVGKPNQKIKPAPLQPIPAIGEPFSKVIIDCVGPLPNTRSGNNYLLTIMCTATRFPEAIPLRKITSQAIVKALTKFFTLFGMPKELQSDQGSNFTSGVFQKAMYQLGINHYTSSAYHPQSQGALERYHQTLKTMIKKFCLENDKDWDEGIHMLLFATREVVQESLGFSPFELVFGHTVRGPLKMVKEEWLKENPSHNVLDFVSEVKYKLHKACEMAQGNLCEAQTKMKTWYDKKARERTFSPGDKVLVLLPFPGAPLRAKFSGPYTIDKKVNDLDYVVRTPDRRKSRRLCHVNMLKEYHERVEGAKPVNLFQEVVDEKESDCQFESPLNQEPGCSPVLTNSEVLANLDAKVSHLDPSQQKDIIQLLKEYDYLFGDTPGQTSLTCHDVDVGNAKPIKQHPYRLNPKKLKQVRKEIKYMLDNNIIEPSQSEWCSPILLVPKPDGTQRLCMDYRKVNAVTKTDSFPIPRIDDCIDKIGNAKYVTKFDLLKGYWQVPLTNRAKEISAFVTPDGLYQCNVMPFGMKNAPGSFQRLMNSIIQGLEGCVIYIDDAVIYSDTWEEHLLRIRAFLDRLANAKLTVNLAKSEFAQAFVTYLGHVVGQGKVMPREAKVQVITEYSIPTTRKQLMRFLGMAGYYRKFCKNFADVVSPLTSLLRKNVKFVWTDSCQHAFDRAKAMLINAPVLMAPDFSKPFKLAIDASDVGTGAVLMQENEQGIDHPVSFFSKKLNKHQQKYSTVEKETLALILAVQQFEVYVTAGEFPVQVYTDHNPLTFLGKMKNKNQRLVRWSLFLQEYNLDIKHIPGKQNVVADALSRVV